MGTFSLLTFLPADTNYVSKLNANVASLETAINGLQNTLGSPFSANLSQPFLLAGLFGGVTSVVGCSSYLATTAGTVLTVSAGIGWYPSVGILLAATTPTVLNFAGLVEGTYYVQLGSTGTPILSASNANSLYSVYWTGATFGAVTLLATVLFSALDDANALTSVGNGVTYTTLEMRLEAIEAAVREDVFLSGTANQVMATPNGASGTAVLRALVAQDIPAILNGTTVSGTLTTTGAATIGGLFTVEGNANFNGNLACNTMYAQASNKITIASPLLVVSNATFDLALACGTLEANSGICYGALQVEGVLTVNSGIVTNIITMGSGQNLGLSAPIVVVSGGLIVDGTSTLGGAVTMNSSLVVDGFLTASDGMSVTNLSAGNADLAVISGTTAVINLMECDILSCSQGVQQSTGIQAARIALNATAAGVGAFVDTAFEWPVQFRDINYTVVISPQCVNQAQLALSIYGLSKTGFTIRATNTAAGANSGITAHIIAFHD